MHTYKWLATFLLMGLSLSLQAINSDSTGKKNTEVQKVLVFRLSGEIDPRTERELSLALQEGREQEVDAVVMELNTFGGRLDAADSMRRMLMDYPVPVVVWINKNAASAGALISLACDSIYMNIGASIGAASVVNQEGQIAPGKYQSYMRSLMRSTAKSSNRDPKIAEQMVFVFADSGEAKQVITLTTQEAIDTGYCEGEARSVDQVLQLCGWENAQRINYAKPVTEKIISFFLNPFISSILITLIFGGIYFELQSPGIGFALIVAILAAVFYFVPYYLNGLAANWELALMAVGFLLIMLEVLVIPGFGLAGISGMVVTLLSLMLIMLNNDFLDFKFVANGDIVASFFAVLGALVLLVLLIFFGGIGFTKTAYFKKIALQTTLAMPPEERARLQNEIPKGSEALTVGPLRPGGKIRYNDKTYEAVTAGEYIAENTKVKVLSRQMNTWKVTKLQS